MWLTKKKIKVLTHAIQKPKKLPWLSSCSTAWAITATSCHKSILSRLLWTTFRARLIDQIEMNQIWVNYSGLQEKLFAAFCIFSSRRRSTIISKWCRNVALGNHDLVVSLTLYNWHVTRIWEKLHVYIIIESVEAKQINKWELKFIHEG